MRRVKLIEAVAKAIARADELNGAPSYEERMAMDRGMRTQLTDEAEAAVEVFEEMWLRGVWHKEDLTQ